METCGEYVCLFEKTGICAVASNVKEQYEAAMRGVIADSASRPRRQGHYAHARTEAVAAKGECKDPGQIDKALAEYPEILPTIATSD